MKKISLKDVKNSLKRDELRQISGGCVFVYGTGYCEAPLWCSDTGNRCCPGFACWVGQCRRHN